MQGCIRNVLFNCLFLLSLATPAASQQLAPIVERSSELIPPPPSSSSVYVSDTGLESMQDTASSSLWTNYCNDCGEANCEGLCGGVTSGFRFVAGIELLHARPTFSQPLAFLRQVRPQGPGANGVQETIDQDVNFDFDHQTNVRASIAFRWNGCGSEIRLVYWSLEADDRRLGTAATNANGNDVFYDLWDVTAVIPGEQLTAHSNIDGDVFDLAYSRCIRAESVCGGCCSPWDLHWSAGVRIADWSTDTVLVTTADSNARADTLRQFDGAGPLVGVDSHRSLSILRGGSVFAAFSTALLLGQYDHSLVRSATVGPNTSREVFLSKNTRVIPVTELEVGIAWQVTALRLSAGWFHQVWWDLGMTEDVSRGDIRYTRDDANVMAWDGLTVRAEVAF